MDVGQTKVAALIAEGQLRMIDAQKVHECGIEIVNTHWIAVDIVAVVVGLAVGCALVNACPRQQHRKAAGVMIAAVIVGR